MIRVRRAFLVAAGFAAALLGCELIVSSTVPDFRCTPGDPTACPSSMSCDPTALICIESAFVEGGNVTVDGPSAREAGGDGPVSTTGAAIGENCTTDLDCKSTLLCGTSTILTTSIVDKTASPICTQTCCTSNDCPDGFVCFGAGTGGNYCISAGRARRTALGTSGPGGSCANDNDCRSGVCDNTHCLDICCAATDCGSGTTCRVKEVDSPPPAREIWVCAASEADAALATGSSCNGTTATCKNDNCSGFPVRCRPPCCSIGSCAEVDPSFGACSYTNFQTTNSVTRFCLDKANVDAGALGQACQGDGDCASRFCDPESKHCSTVCCRDSDCASGTVCRPSASGGPLLHCVAPQ